jgi:hypothetical protein
MPSCSIPDPCYFLVDRFSKTVVFECQAQAGSSGHWPHFGGKVIAVNNEMAARISMVGLLALSCVLATSASGRSQETTPQALTAEGVVVAVQLELGATRSTMDVGSSSLGDFAEVWMVRVGRWSRPNAPKYILVEYAHANRHEPFVRDSELDRTVWKFSIDSVAQNQQGACVSWGERFVPTAFGKRDNLPAPKSLQCFQMRKRPAPVIGR